MKKQFTLFLMLITMLVAAGCSKEDTGPKYKINSPTLTTNYDKEFQFAIEGNPENIQWSSSEESVGTIDGDGLFTASKIGVTTVTAKMGSSSVQSEVTVESYGEFFMEPVSEFGSSKESVKAREKRKLDAEATQGLLFDGENEFVRNALYNFIQGKLNGSFILFANQAELVEKVANFYGERYLYVGASDDYIFFDNSQGAIIGISFSADLGFHAGYIPKSSTKAAAIMMSIKKDQTLKSSIKTLNR